MHAGVGLGCHQVDAVETSTNEIVSFKPVFAKWAPLPKLQFHPQEFWLPTVAGKMAVHHLKPSKKDGKAKAKRKPRAKKLGKDCKFRMAPAPLQSGLASLCL